VILTDIFKSVDLIIYSELILIYIIVNLYRKHTQSEQSTKLFLCIAYVLSVDTILEGVTWAINGLHYPLDREISMLTNTILLACNSLPAITWVAYADYKIFNDYKKMKKRIRFYLIPFYISVILLTINLWTGIVFTIDETNVYSRSAGLYVIPLMTYAMITVLYFSTRKYKKQINGKIMQSIFLFMLIPIAAGILQMLFYGILLIWPAFIFATLIAFIQVEKDAVSKDTLTGLATREQLERRMQYLTSKSIGFSVIMADMNGFKMINDQFGHQEGDQALTIVASILKHNVKSFDLICRYGGDEFVILLESDDHSASGKVSKRIRQEAEAFNRKMAKPYQLSMSFGHAYWNPGEKKPQDELMREVDAMMYKDKELYKALAAE
jgi:diguanylate cyclase (GGDEF)-like protein